MENKHRCYVFRSDTLICATTIYEIIKSDIKARLLFYG